MRKKEKDAGEKRNKRKEERKRREGEKERRGEKERKGRWEDRSVKPKKRRRTAARCRGWETKLPGELWQTLGFGVRWALGRGWATLAILKIFLFCKNNLAINFRKRRRPSRYKYFPTILEK